MATPERSKLVYEFLVLINEISDLVVDNEECGHPEHEGVHDMSNDDLYDLVLDWRERARELRSRT